MLQLTVKQSQAFFFDRAKVMAATDKARRRNLVRAGALVRTAARRSMRPARRMRLTELDSEAQQAHKIKLAIAKREGRAKPLLPFKSSQPGEPPRTRDGQIKRFLFFVYDPSTNSVIVGPAAQSNSTGAPATLEFGGKSKLGYIAKRPYMRPAEERVRRQYLQLWRNSIV